MKKTFFGLFFCLFILSTYAQQSKNIPFFDSEKVLLEGIEKIRNEEYREGERLYKTIPFGDYYYVHAQFELSTSYYLQQRYNEAIYILESLIPLESDVKKSLIYSQLGEIYYTIKMYDKAIENYDKAIKYEPYKENWHYWKGMALLQIQELEQAEKSFKQAIFCAPYSQESHYQLGISYLEQKMFIPGILALNFAVLLQTNTETALEALQLLDRLYVKGLDNFATSFNTTQSASAKQRNERYKQLENLVRINVAMHKKFKLKTDINHVIVRQNQLIFENITPLAHSYTIEDQLYIPFFQRIGANKKDFHVYSYLMFCETDLQGGEIQKKSQEMDKKNKNFLKKGREFINESAYKGLGVAESDSLYYTYTDNRLTNFGPYVINRKGEQIPHGTHIYIDENGGIELQASFKEGIKDGLWVAYNRNGESGMAVSFKNDVLDGALYTYFENEKEQKRVKVERTYKNAVIEGIGRDYNRAGIMIEEALWKDDLYDGECTTYFSQGNIETQTTFQAGIPVGLSMYYYENGTIQGKVNHAPLDSIGYALLYYEDGSLYQEGSVRNNMRAKDWKYYFPSGKIYVEMTYNDEGNPDGTWKEYNQEGELVLEKIINDKNQEQTEIIYNSIGNIIRKIDYQDSNIIQVINFFPDGTEKEKIVPQNKTMKFNLYYGEVENDGIEKSCIVQLTGEKKGNIKYYYPSGKIKKEVNYLNNKSHGESKTYYPSGKIETIQNFTDGMENGLYLKYYPNDTLQEEAYFIDGKREVCDYEYYMNGNIKVQRIYAESEISYAKYFFPNRQLQSEEFYHKGLLTQVNFYNEKEELFQSDTFSHGNGPFYSYYLNGKPSTFCQMVAGKMKDTCYWYNMNGEVVMKLLVTESKFSGQYNIYDFLDSSWLVAEYNYLLNNEHGEEKMYHRNDKLASQGFYEHGEREGRYFTYFDNGNVKESLFYRKDLREGVATFYAVDGKTVLYQLKFINDEAVAYSYQGKEPYVAFTNAEPTHIVAYFPNGRIAGEVTFIGGKKQGTERYYYPNGEKYSEINFDDDLRHGSAMYWYENGKLKEQLAYQYHYFHGTRKVFFPNGKLYQESHFIEDMPHQIAREYRENGEIVKSQEWFYGNRMK